MGTIGDLIHRTLSGRTDEAEIAAVRAEVRELCGRFVPYPELAV
jgi:hypothetical protein